VEPTKEQFYLRRIAELEGENAQLRAENAQLRQQNAQLTAQVAQLTEHVADLLAQVAKLTEQVARLSKNSSNSSKPPSSDIVKPPKTKPKPSGDSRRPGGRPGHPGANRPLFRADQVDRIESLHPCGCPNGHPGALEPLERLERPKGFQVAELREKPLDIIEYRLYGGRCSICGQIVWAAPPPGVAEGQIFGPRLQATIAHMKGSLHASYSGLQEFCREVLGIGVSRSHLCNTIARVSTALAAPHRQLRDHIPTEPVLNIDESGWKENGAKFWIWIFCTSAVSFFQIAKSRGSKVLQEVLGQTYDGTIVSDFFSAYVKYANRLQQFCLAHLIRDIKFLTTLPGDSDKQFGQLLLVEFRRLFHLWHMREKIPRTRFDPVMFRIRDRILHRAAGAVNGPPSKSRTLARRLVKHGESIFRFLFDHAVEPTNNAAERGIRPSVMDRRVTQGSRSMNGRQWNERIWTVLGTCRKQRRSAWRFLHDALLASQGQIPTPSLLPSGPAGA